jgi:hypothetical protein
MDHACSRLDRFAGSRCGSARIICHDGLPLKPILSVTPEVVASL